jgi:hypothetical protein
MMTGTTDDGRENSSGCVITGETGLAHTRTIVDNEGGNFFLHCDRLGGDEKCRIKQKVQKKSY